MLRRRNFSSSFMRQRVRFYQTACGSCSWTKKAATCAGLFASGMLFSYAYSRRGEELVFAAPVPIGVLPGDQQRISADQAKWGMELANKKVMKKEVIPDESDGLCSLAHNRQFDKMKELLGSDDKKGEEGEAPQSSSTLMRLAGNFYGRAGVTPLMIACYRGDNRVVEFLLENKANTDQKSTFFPAKENLDILQSQSTSRSAPSQHDVNLTNILGDNQYLQDLVFSAPTAWSRYLFNVYFPDLPIDNHGLKPIDFAIAGKQYDIIRKLLASGSPEPDLQMHTAHLSFQDKQYVLKAVEAGRLENFEIQRKKRSQFPLEARLAERIVGQRHGLGLVSSAIRRKENGWVDTESPLVMLFMGSSGIGKTETAKLVAKYLFEGKMRNTKVQDEKSQSSLADFMFGTGQKKKPAGGRNKELVKKQEMAAGGEPEWMKCFVRMDMTEYQEKHEVSKFIGAPPGYVGYDDGGQLVNKLRDCPNAVVLLDEVEKANRDMLTVMLQAFDEGRLTDGQGNTVDCKDAIFVMTSNLAQQQIADEAIRLRDAVVDSKEGGKTISTVDGLTKSFKQTVIQPILRRHFGRDEFLGRINEIVFFLPFTAQEQQELAEKELQIWQKRAKARHNIDLTWTENVSKFAAEGYDLRYGARSIKYEIDRTCIAPIARAQEEGKAGRGYKVQLDVTKPGEQLPEVSSGKALLDTAKAQKAPDAKHRPQIKLNISEPAPEQVSTKASAAATEFMMRTGGY